MCLLFPSIQRALLRQTGSDEGHEGLIKPLTLISGGAAKIFKGCNEMDSPTGVKKRRRRKTEKEREAHDGRTLESVWTHVRPDDTGAQV